MPRFHFMGHLWTGWSHTHNHTVESLVSLLVCYGVAIESRVLLNAHFYLGRGFTFKFLDSGIILAQSRPYCRFSYLFLFKNILSCDLLNLISTPKYT